MSHSISHPLATSRVPELMIASLCIRAGVASAALQPALVQLPDLLHRLVSQVLPAAPALSANAVSCVGDSSVEWPCPQGSPEKALDESGENLSSIQAIVQYALKTGYLSLEAEERLRRLLQGKYSQADRRAFMQLQAAAMAGEVRQESREKRHGHPEISADRLSQPQC